MDSLRDNGRNWIVVWIVVGFIVYQLLGTLWLALSKLKEGFGPRWYRLYRAYCLAFLVVLACLACYAAAFSKAQSAVLACISAFTAFIATKFSASRPPQFQPFRVQILAQWRALLEDHGFIDNEAQWEQLAAEAEQNKSRTPVDFTVLAPDLCNGPQKLDTKTAFS